MQVHQMGVGKGDKECCVVKCDVMECVEIAVSMCAFECYSVH